MSVETSSEPPAPASEVAVPPGRRRRPRKRWWLGAVALSVLLGIGGAIAVDVARGGPSGVTLHRLLTGDYRPQGARVEIRPGHALYLDCRGRGTPTIVLEAGMGDGIKSFTWVLDDFARITRTCGYDRSGRDRSDPGSGGDFAGDSAELTELLARSGEHPPYVIVGHSIGADLARVHATLRRQDVVGLVLLDGFDPDIFDDRVVPNLGPLRDQYLDYTATLWSMIAGSEKIDAARSAEQVRASDVRGLPIEVVLAPRIDARLDEAANNRITEALEAGYEALSPGRVKVTFAWGAGHMVQADRPDVVVDAVRRLVASLRS